MYLRDAWRVSLNTLTVLEIYIVRIQHVTLGIGCAQLTKTADTTHLVYQLTNVTEIYQM